MIKSSALPQGAQVDKTGQLYYIFAHHLVLADPAPQVAEANRGRPGTIKINEIC